MTARQISKVFTATAVDQTFQLKTEFGGSGVSYFMVINESDLEKVYIRYDPLLQATPATINGDDQYVILPGMFRKVPYSDTWRIIATGSCVLEISSDLGLL